MNFILKPTLEHIALVKVASALWNQQEIRSLVIKFSNSPLFSHVDKEPYIVPIRFSERKKKWQQIEDKVSENVSQLSITVYLEDKILSYIQSVGIQILRWMEFHCRTCDLDLDLPNEFFWTAQGTVDKQKTAEMLIKDDCIDITIRFKLACVYCFQDEIASIWSEMPENDRKLFYCDGKVLQTKLVGFWTCAVNGENNRMSSYLNTFESAAGSGNKAATEFFLQKLNSKEYFLEKAAVFAVTGRHEDDPRITHLSREYCADVLIFLLSQMSSELQVKLFKECPSELLRCMLEWPFQTIFVETACRLWNFLPKQKYHYVLRTIIHKIIYAYKDFNYVQLFEEFWQQIPNTLKSYVIKDSCIAGLVHMLLQIKDKKKVVHIFKVIFQDATPVDKNKVIFSRRGRSICNDLIEYHQWDLVKFFIKLCITSKDEVIKFKRKFIKHNSIYRHPFLNSHLIKKRCGTLFKILDDSYECNKRKNEDESDNSLAKKLCNN